jgi:hypothetical protein
VPQYRNDSLAYKGLVILFAAIGLCWIYVITPSLNRMFTPSLAKLAASPYFILATDFKLASEVEFILKHKFDPAHNETELCKIMNVQQSDKGRVGTHNYTQLYHYLFRKVRDRPLHIFEVGLGTNHLDVASNMGKEGVPGASLRGWRDFFPHSHVYGADIDQRVLFREERIATYYVDQLKPDSIIAMWEALGPQKMDIILDDGLHSFAANTIFLKYSFPHLKRGGFYIIEDILMTESNLADFYHYMLANHYHAVIAKLPNSANSPDNCVVIIKAE